MEKKKNSLSMTNFKNSLTGELVDPATLNDEEYIDYVLSGLLKETIELLEMAVPGDRVFARSKFQIMSIFHQAQSKLHSRNINNG